MADFKVLWTEAAKLDLQRIITFIAEENPARALAVSEQVEDRCQALVAWKTRDLTPGFCTAVGFGAGLPSIGSAIPSRETAR